MVTRVPLGTTMDCEVARGMDVLAAVEFGTEAWGAGDEE